MSTSVAEAGVESAALAGKYLTFMLSEETYGVQILKVQEIMGLMPITRVPRTPACIRGVINLRGKVIPVLDLSLRFGMTAQDDTARTCIIVVRLATEQGQIIMGMIVDSVSEVVDIPGAHIEPPPQLGAGVDTAFLLGMGKIGERVVMLLDVDAVLTTHETEAIASVAAEHVSAAAE